MKSKSKGALSQQETQLIEAAKGGDAGTIKKLVEAGTAVDARDSRGAPWDVTALMYAAGHGQAAAVRMLLSLGASPSARDADLPGEGGGRTALHYAARARSVECAAELVKAGADVNALAKGAAGTPLEIAIPPARARIQLAADGKNAAAVSEQHEGILKITEYLLSAGADPNIPNKSTGGIPLHSAAMFGDVALVETLLRAGARPTYANATGATPFNLAAAKKQANAAMAILRAGIDLEHKDNSGATPLMWAIWGRIPAVAIRLIDIGALINQVNKEGKTALDIALETEQPEIVARLTAAGAKRSANRKVPV